MGQNGERASVPIYDDGQISLRFECQRIRGITNAHADVFWSGPLGSTVAGSFLPLSGSGSVAPFQQVLAEDEYQLFGGPAGYADLTGSYIFSTGGSAGPVVLNFSVTHPTPADCRLDGVAIAGS
jgi:hypothetical protein